MGLINDIFNKDQEKGKKLLFSCNNKECPNKAVITILETEEHPEYRKCILCGQEMKQIEEGEVALGY